MNNFFKSHNLSLSNISLCTKPLPITKHFRNIITLYNVVFHRQAHFPLPQSLDPNTSEFISLADAKNVLEQLNKILRGTGFNPQPSNPLFFICILLSLILGR